MKDQLLTKDHDILVRLEEKFDAFNREMIDGANNRNLRIADLNARVTALENVNTKYSGNKYVPMIEAHDLWIHDFKVRWQFIVASVVILSSAITFILSVLLRAICLFRSCSI